jgi:transposase
MIKTVGIDLASAGEHRVRCLDEQGQPCDGFTFATTIEGLAKLEDRIFTEQSNPTIVFEPTGLAWIHIAIYLRARHPDCRLVRVQAHKVAALRRYLRRSSKSDRVDSLTLAKIPLVDAEQLEEVYLPPAKIYAMQRLARQRKRLEGEIAGHKTRINSIIDGYLPGLRQAFSDPWSSHARAFFCSRLNPMQVVRASERALHVFLSKERSNGKQGPAESHVVYLACGEAATIFKLADSAGTVNDDFFDDLQDEISREFRILSMLEAECESIASRLKLLYLELHPSDNLRTIPGVGEHTAPIFLATVGDTARFRNQSAFANYTGVIPSAKQSSLSEAKGLGMTKAGPATLKWALFQAGQISRRCDPQLANVYYRQMVQHGKNHRQAMGAVMSHLAARILSVLREDKPYVLRDLDGNPITNLQAHEIIDTKYRVPEEIRKERRRRKAGAEGSKRPRKASLTMTPCVGGSLAV